MIILCDDYILWWLYCVMIIMSDDYIVWWLYWIILCDDYILWWLYCVMIIMCDDYNVWWLYCVMIILDYIVMIILDYIVWWLYCPEFLSSEPVIVSDFSDWWQTISVSCTDQLGSVTIFSACLEVLVRTDHYSRHYSSITVQIHKMCT
jgi:hypothetical protein